MNIRASKLNLYPVSLVFVKLITSIKSLPFPYVDHVLLLEGGDIDPCQSFNWFPSIDPAPHLWHK